MFAGNKRLFEGCDFDLQRNYKPAIKKYTEGVEIILEELEKDKSKATEELLRKIDKYIERIKLLKAFVNSRDDGNPSGILLPKEPTTTPIVKKTEDKSKDEPVPCIYTI